MDYGDKLPSRPVVHFYAAAPVHFYAAVDTHVLNGAGNVDWRTFAGPAKALLDGRVLETMPIMEYVCERTYRALAIEELR